MTIAFRPLRNPNPLGFPGGVLPGFDPAHVAWAGGARLSCVNIAGNLVNTITGKRATIAGTPTQVLDRQIGGATYINNTGDLATFGGMPLTNDAKVTLGIIFVPKSFSGTPLYVWDNDGSNSNRGTWIGATTGGNFETASTAFSTTIASGITLSVGVPYFVAASINWAGAATVANFIVLRLDTGAVTTATVTAAPSASAPGAGTSGNYVVGGFDGTSDIAHAQYAAAMVSTTFLSIPQLLAWAADPWAFWYPRRDSILVGAAAAAAFKAYWAQQSNLPVIGTGTY